MSLLLVHRVVQHILSLTFLLGLALSLGAGTGIK